MSFQDAVRAVLTNYVGFSGRARRSEYWWYALFATIAIVVVMGIDLALGTYPLLYSLLALALFLPGLAVTMRRLHDTGRSGALVLLGLIPFVGGIILLVFCVGDSQPGSNQYGPSPKALVA